MIIIDPSVAVLSTAEYLHTKTTFGVVDSFKNPFDTCCFGMCEIPLPVFADLPNQTINRNNDFSKFIFSVPIGSTVELILTNLNTNTDYPIIDTTYGAFADVGDLAVRPDVFAFVLNWYKVADLIAFGDYQLSVIIKNSSSTTIFEDSTPRYNLRPYSCEAALGTVRFDVTQEGYIQDGFNFRTMTGLAGLFKVQQIRVYGSLDKTPITVTDYLSSSARENIQVQTEIHHEYEVSVLYLSGNTYDLFFKNLLLENPIIVNTYNAFDSKEYEGLKVSYLNASKEPKSRSKQERATITFEDHKKATVKRY